MGYDAGEYLNNDAAAAYSVMSASKIYIVASHGIPGRLKFGTNSNASYIYANSTVTGNNRSISNLSSNALSNTRLIMYITCESGQTSSSYGNLVTSTHSKGAQCTVGWYGSMYNDSANDWIRLFFEKADEDHDVIWECFNHADYWVEDIYGSEDAEILINRHERGNINQYLYQ